MIIQRIIIFALAIFELVASQEDAIWQPTTSPQLNQWKFESTETMNETARAIIKKVLSVEQAEGVGARVRRSVGRREVSSSYSVYNIIVWGPP